MNSGMVICLNEKVAHQYCTKSNTHAAVCSLFGLHLNDGNTLLRSSGLQTCTKIRYAAASVKKTKENWSARMMSPHKARYKEIRNQMHGEWLRHGAACASHDGISQAEEDAVAISLCDDACPLLSATQNCLLPPQ